MWFKANIEPIFYSVIVCGGLLLFQNCGAPQSRIESQILESHQYEASGLESPNEESAVLLQMDQKALADFKQSELLLAGYELYSAETLIETTDTFDFIWFGGFLNSQAPAIYHKQLDQGADPSKIFGPDRIFRANRFLGDVHKVAASTELVFEKVGYHVNDPSLIAPPSTSGVNRKSWLYMYYTMLDNRLPENCRKANKNLLQCPEVFAGHDIGFASSVDGGKTWTDRGVVIAANKSGDGKGAWMPTVLNVGSEIHIYYSTGRAEFSTPNIFFQRLQADGHTKIGNPQRIVIPGFKNGDQVHNIDIKVAQFSQGKKYLMISNDGTHRKIRAYISNDGKNFKETKSPLLSSEGSSDYIFTPHIIQWGPNTINDLSSGTFKALDSFAFVHVSFSKRPQLRTKQSAYEFRQQMISFDLND